MSKKLLVLLLLAMLLPSVFSAISYQSALDFVQNDGYFLYKNESVRLFPESKVRSSGQYYWMVAVGDPVIAYIPVFDKSDLAVLENAATQRALIKTAEVMWYISNFKGKLSSQDQWFFSTANSSFFSSLGNVLEGEAFELDSIKTELKDSKANTEILAMNSLLAQMSDNSALLAKQITSAMKIEQDFFNSPDANQLDYFKRGFSDAFETVALLNDEVLSYNNSITRLKSIISSSSLDAGVKNQLLSFANAPQQLFSVSSKAVAADSVKQAVDSAFSTALSRSKDLVDNLTLRIKRNKAGTEIFSADPDFKKKTDGKFETLSSAAEIILSSDYFSLWKNQDALAELSENYQKAQSLFDKGDYDLSMTFSARAKTSAVRVLEDGYTPQDNPTIDWNLWILFAIALIILFIIIFALRNRKKLSALVQQQNTGEEVGVYAWEKR